jgi:basic amino acid/polyamine antiporter, APA family
MVEEPPDVRTMGLAGATGVGVGAIVGGGILALAGVAFSTTGPGAIVAFALNGAIAALTALSFAEMSAAFPESGGTYTFAKKVLNVRVAFGVGWVVWFASLVAAVLYALGFGAFLSMSLQEVFARTSGNVPVFLHSSWAITGFAVVATLWFAHRLLRRSGGGGQWMNVTKSAVFALVIAAGLWTLTRDGSEEFVPKLSPFFSGGTSGLFQAMGFTFIALQGFDLIAAVAGEVKDPGRNVPRAMVASLGIALAIYLPLLFVVAAAGIERGESITALASAQPEGVVAIAARRFLGDFGYWLIMVAGVLSMASALQANLFAASRVGYAMGRDRTLPPSFGRVDAETGIPRRAVWVVAVIVIVVAMLVPDVATAGAASSLIFLVTFALAHYINILVRRRMDASAMPFRVPGFPLVPIVGGMACMGLAFFQGVSVPVAGVITVMWLTAGVGLYAFRFGGRAKTFDASAEAVDPLLVKYRGRNPLVLLPVDDAVNVVSLVTVAHAICPPGLGRVLLLSAVEPPAEWKRGEVPASLTEMSDVLREAVYESFASGLAPEAMMTVAANHWNEIGRVARLHQCESVVLGFRSIVEQAREPGFNELVSTAVCDVVLLRMPRGWQFLKTRRVLIPIGGRGMHSPLRARLLGSLRRSGGIEVSYLCLRDKSASKEDLRRARRVVRMRAEDEMSGRAEAIVDQSDDPAAEIIRRAADVDLLILGLQQARDHRRAISDFTLRIASGTSCALIVLGQKQDQATLKLPESMLPGVFGSRRKRGP